MFTLIAKGQSTEFYEFPDTISIHGTDSDVVGKYKEMPNLKDKFENEFKDATAFAIGGQIMVPIFRGIHYEILNAMGVRIQIIE